MRRSRRRRRSPSRASASGWRSRERRCRIAPRSDTSSVSCGSRARSPSGRNHRYGSREIADHAARRRRRRPELRRRSPPMTLSATDGVGGRPRGSRSGSRSVRPGRRGRCRPSAGARRRRRRRRAAIAGRRPPAATSCGHVEDQLAARMDGADALERARRGELLTHGLVRADEPRADVVTPVVEVDDLDRLADRRVERAGQDLERRPGVERLAGADGNRVLVRGRPVPSSTLNPGSGVGTAVGAGGGERQGRAR